MMENIEAHSQALKYDGQAQKKLIEDYVNTMAEEENKKKENQRLKKLKKKQNKKQKVSENEDSIKTENIIVSEKRNTLLVDDENRKESQSTTIENQESELDNSYKSDKNKISKLQVSKNPFKPKINENTGCSCTINDKGKLKKCKSCKNTKNNIKKLDQEITKENNLLNQMGCNDSDDDDCEQCKSNTIKCADVNKPKSVKVLEESEEFILTKIEQQYRKLFKTEIS